MYAILNRLRDNTSVQTLGRWYFHEGLKEVFSCVTLELPDRGNQNNISRVPATLPGKPYRVKKRWSPKFKHHFHVTGVDGRTYILVHVLNTFHQTEGCIGVGYGFGYVNHDREMDIYMSRDTLDRMLALAPDEFDLYINDNDL
ncbi:hypothetical protein SAMN05192545_2911 [Maribacter dokdonensis]|uniref:DUF5675 domain-containing protein n=1 Tax=Maribacter dokdonensis TaxID=320912 RepID=A0ABY0UTS4_9FLAO|nr:DUF5675 family protein [Maribacter dokdonensis]SDT16222.1 hypothetical protein SAMN05192545_2911 [Maribacter dokdonensis]